MFVSGWEGAVTGRNSDSDLGSILQLVRFSLPLAHSEMNNATYSYATGAKLPPPNAANGLPRFPP